MGFGNLFPIKKQNNQAVELVIPYWMDNNAEQASIKLMNEATKQWEDQDCSRDDITCIILFLQRNDENGI